MHSNPEVNSKSNAKAPMLMKLPAKNPSNQLGIPSSHLKISDRLNLSDFVGTLDDCVQAEGRSDQIQH